MWVCVLSIFLVLFKVLGKVNVILLDKELFGLKLLEGLGIFFF